MDDLTVEERYIKLLEAAAVKIERAGDRAETNGFVTKKEVDASTEKINKSNFRVTVTTAAATLISILVVLTYLLSPIIKRQDEQQKDIREVMKDVRELYKVSPSANRSERLEAPAPTSESK